MNMLLKRQRIVVILTSFTLCLMLMSAVHHVAAGPRGAGPIRKDVFHRAAVSFDENLKEGAVQGNHRRLLRGQSLQRTIDLPPLPADQRDATGIMAHVRIEPVQVRKDGRLQPGDPWTRMGSVNLVIEGGDNGFDNTAGWEDRDLETYPTAEEIELIRFITGFGGPVEFNMDMTSLAPLLHGSQTLRLYVSTYAEPAWTASLTLHYLDDEPGMRRPVFAERLFNDQNVSAKENVVRGTIEIPEGLAMPRLRLITSGHTTDGKGGDEFLPRTHVLRVDGQEILRFRPWSEAGAPLRDRNPTSGRLDVEGRTLWSSDLDRTGWHPGMGVEPMVIPLPELTAGKHSIEVEILGIRESAPAPDGSGAGHGYWRVSGIVVADEPWPQDS